MNGGAFEIFGRCNGHEPWSGSVNHPEDDVDRA
jgi:hypothetical protein